MKKYFTTITCESDFYEKLQFVTTPVKELLFEVSKGNECVFLQQELYDSLITHPAFRDIYTLAAFHSPTSEAFLLGGAFYVKVKSDSFTMKLLTCIEKENNERERQEGDV